MWYGALGIGLAVAALLGQREAQAILLLWIAWPVVRGILLAIPKSLRKKEEKEDIEVIEAEVLEVEWEDNSQRRALPRSTRPELPDPDTIETEWKELPPLSTPPRWKTVLATVIALLGSLLFLIGFLGALATLFR